MEILKNIFTQNIISAVIHFAGVKAVGESEKYPLKYYENNVSGSINLLQAMTAHNIKKIIFSSSATVYGEQKFTKFNEETAFNPKNVYGKTKMIVENILEDLYQKDHEWRIMTLRYFNPIGAHYSGLIGENPTDYPNNLLPSISQVAIGKSDKLFVYGDDYPTSDGTGKRDYIHVEDLSRAHLNSLEYLNKKGGYNAVNLGTGKSYSVFEVIKSFQKASGIKIPFEVYERRPGDISECFTDPSKAKKLLGWESIYTLEQMCEDAWRWQKNNPNGYDS